MKKIIASALTILMLTFLSACLPSDLDYSANTQSDVLIVTSSTLSEESSESTSSEENSESTSSEESSLAKQNSSKTQNSSSAQQTSSEQEISYEPVAPQSSEAGDNTVTVPDEAETGDNLVWVPVNGGTKYHTKSSCSKMKDPIQVSLDTAIKNGYTACKRCH